MASIGEMLAAKNQRLDDPTTLPRVSEKTRNRWARAQTEQVISWLDESLGTVRLLVEGAQLGQTITEGATSWTPVHLADTVENEVTIHTRVRPAHAHILIGQAVGDVFQKVTSPDREPFRIPIGRSGNSGVYTFKNKKDGQNDYRLQFLDLDTSALVVLEIGFTVRDGTCWIHQQETYEGALVMLSEEETAQFEGRMVRETIDDVELLVGVVPTNALYAHEDANPFTVFQECRQLVQLAIKEGSIIPPLADWPVEERPIWSPDFPVVDRDNLPKAQGRGPWIPAVVMWFNGTLGWGFAMTASDDRVFLHFNGIRGWNGEKPTARGHWPIVHGLQPVLVRAEIGDRGLRATAIVPVASQ